MSCCGANPYYQDCVPSCTKPYPCSKSLCNAPLCVRGPQGPSSPYSPTSFFQVALAQTFSYTTPTLIPFSIISAGNADFSFDSSTGEFVAPALGFYQFNFSVTMSNPGISTSLESVNVSVDGNFLSCATCTLSPGAALTVSGSTVLQLLPDQRVGLIVTTNSGATVQGPNTIAAPPYPSIFTGFSFF